MDIQFKKPELEDREYINSYIHKQCSRSCEYTFANIYLWSRLYPVEYGTVENMVVFKTLDGENMFAFPMGEPQYLKGCVDALTALGAGREIFPCGSTASAKNSLPFWKTCIRAVFR